MSGQRVETHIGIKKPATYQVSSEAPVAQSVRAPYL